VFPEEFLTNLHIIIPMYLTKHFPVQEHGYWQEAFLFKSFFLRYAGRSMIILLLGLKGR
jgi:hypothetical protein